MRVRRKPWRALMPATLGVLPLLLLAMPRLRAALEVAPVADLARAAKALGVAAEAFGGHGTDGRRLQARPPPFGTFVGQVSCGASLSIGLSEITKASDAITLGTRRCPEAAGDPELENVCFQAVGATAGRFASAAWHLTEASISCAGSDQFCAATVTGACQAMLEVIQSFSRSLQTCDPNDAGPFDCTVDIIDTIDTAAITGDFILAAVEDCRNSTGISEREAVDSQAIQEPGASVGSDSVPFLPEVIPME